MLNEDQANAFPFKSLCEIFEKMEKASGAESKLKYIFNKDIKAYLNNESIYPIMRLLLPVNDNERGSYGLKQALIAKTYVEALHLNKNSVDAETLLYWKDPSKIHSGSSALKTARGDFCHILENILQSRVRTEYSNNTVKHVNDVLTELSNCVNMASKVEIIRNKILNNYNAREQKWIMRILFQDVLSLC